MAKQPQHVILASKVKIKPKIIKMYGPTLLINGDNIRNIFKLFDYSVVGRVNTFKKFGFLAKFITNQKINLIFTAVGLNRFHRKWLKKNIDNLVGILVKSDINKIIKMNKKNTYKLKNKVVGINIKPYFPKSEIIIKNNFNKNIDKIADELMKKIITVLK